MSDRRESWSRREFVSGLTLAADDQRGADARAEAEVSDTDARLWHPWLRINRVLRVMLHTRWSAEAWPQVKAEFTKALAARGERSSG